MTLLNLLQRSSPPATGTHPAALFLLPALLVLLGFVHGWQAHGEARLTQNLNRLQEQSQQIARRADAARQRESACAELSTRHGLIDKLERRRVLTRKRLTAVVDEVADGMWIVEVSQSPTQISLRGVSASAEEVSQFLAGLEAHPELGRLQHLDVSRASGEGPPQAAIFTFTARTQLSETPLNSAEEGGNDAPPGNPSA